MQLAKAIKDKVSLTYNELQLCGEVLNSFPGLPHAATVCTEETKSAYCLNRDNIGIDILNQGIAKCFTFRR